MIANDRLTTYINSLGAPLPQALIEIEREAIKQQVPIIRKDMQGLLRLIISMQHPSSILEVGTAVGFSGSLMLTLAPDARLTTIENYEPRFDIARANFKRAGVSERAEFLTGDAMEILPTLTGPFDMIFMDAAKGQYIHFLPEIMRLLTPGGLLISDNVLQDGDIIESRFAVCRRDRTIHKRMREYLYALTHTEGLVTTILDTGDGVALSHKEK